MAQRRPDSVASYDEGGPAWRNRGQCGYKDCKRQGLVRTFTITGWINLCEPCYGKFYAENYNVIPKRIQHNAVCDEIRSNRRIR